MGSEVYFAFAIGFARTPVLPEAHSVGAVPPPTATSTAAIRYVRSTSTREVRLLGTNSARRGVGSFFQERWVLAQSFHTGIDQERALRVDLTRSPFRPGMPALLRTAAIGRQSDESPMDITGCQYPPIAPDRVRRGA
jgi:hypothetical protein